MAKSFLVHAYDIAFGAVVAVIATHVSWFPPDVVRDIASQFLAVSASFSAMVVACLALITALLGDDMFSHLAIREERQDGVLKKLGRPFLMLSVAWVISMLCFSGVLICRANLGLARFLFVLGTVASAYCLQGVALMTWLCISVFETRASWFKTLRESKPSLAPSTLDRLKNLLEEAKLSLRAGAPIAATWVCLMILTTLCDEMDIPSDLELHSRVAHLEENGIIRHDMIVRLESLLRVPINETSEKTAELLVQEVSDLLSFLLGL